METISRLRAIQVLLAALLGLFIPVKAGAKASARRRRKHQRERRKPKDYNRVLPPPNICVPLGGACSSAQGQLICCQGLTCEPPGVCAT